MADTTKSISVLITGGDRSAGLAAAKALVAAGHRVTAIAGDSAGALAIRRVGALPVFTDLSRSGEVRSALQMAKADALLHAAPQVILGLPQADINYQALGERVASQTQAVMRAAADVGVQRVISLSGAQPSAALQAAEAAAQASGTSAYILRAGYVYGGNSCATSALASEIRRSGRPLSGDLPASWIHEDDLASAMLALLMGDGAVDGLEILSAAADSRESPNEFAMALASALGLNAPRFASPGIFAALRQKTARDDMLARETLVDSRELRERFGWKPRHASIESGLEATALTWRLRDAVDADAFYGYEDAAAEAIAAIVYDVALPEPVVEEAAAPAAQPAAEAAPAPVKAAAPPPSDGPTPWSEDEAKREERRRKALERRAKRAAKSARA